MPGPERIEQGGVHGWFHQPLHAPKAALGLTHGAGSNCEAALLVALAEAFVAHDWAVLRYDLPYRQLRPTGSPVGSQAKDRDGIRAVAAWLRGRVAEAPLYLGGHSYGGRQTNMLAAEDSKIADALLMLSYPLHPPKQPEKPRTAHFPELKVRTLFVHGTRDEFGTIAELEVARLLIPAHTELQTVQGAPHGLPAKFAPQIAEWFVTFTNK